MCLVLTFHSLVLVPTVGILKGQRLVGLKSSLVSISVYFQGCFFLSPLVLKRNNDSLISVIMLAGFGKKDEKALFTIICNIFLVNVNSLPG